MKAIRMGAGVCLLSMLCALGVQGQERGQVGERIDQSRLPVASAPALPGEDGGTSTLGTAPELSVFSVMKFSGVLKDISGQPRSGIAGVTFALYSEQEGGAPLWLETQNIQPDGQGRYSVLLGALQAEGLPRELFASGEARWLGLQVETEPEQPRILLVSVPYALKAAEAETLGGRTASEFVLTERLETEIQQKAETIVRAEVKTLTTAGAGTTKGITDSASTFIDANSTEVVLVQQNGTGNGLRAVARAGTGSTKGLWGQSNSTGGKGVLGLAPAGAGVTAGVVGQSNSTGGKGVFGLATAATGQTKGVQGQVSSTGGRGVFGLATAGTGATTGVWGQSNSTGGKGVFGLAPASTGVTTGVVGQSNSTGGKGLFGLATAGTGQTKGVLGQVNSAAGTGGVFRNTAGGKILSGRSTGNTEVFSVDGSGKIEADGGLMLDGLRVEPNGISPNVLGGFSGNSVTSGVVGATIGGGGENVLTNRVTDGSGTVGGGLNNQAGDNAGTIFDAPAATVGGGSGNTASGLHSTVGGGFTNTASGLSATVPGGQFNTAQGQFSFAAGLRAKALHTGAFVWGDSTDADVASTGVNQFVVRAAGGAFFSHTVTATAFVGDGSGLTNVSAGTASNADTLDGLDSTQLARVDTANTFSGTQTAPAFVGGTGSFTGDVGVSGNLQVNGQLTIPTTTRFFSVPATSFVPVTGNVVDFNRINFLSGTVSADTLIFDAPIHLPDNATVTGIRLTAFDDDATQDFQVSLFEFVSGLAPNLKGGVSTSGSPGLTSVNASVSAFQVFNSTSTYFVRATWDVPSSPTKLRLRSVHIAYTITGPLP